MGVLGQVSSQVGFAELEAASRNQSVALEVADLRRPEDFNGAFATMISKQVEAAAWEATSRSPARRRKRATATSNQFGRLEQLRNMRYTRRTC